MYYNVQEEVKNHFNNLIRKYHFRFDYQTPNTVKLINEFCGIYITEERGGEIYIAFDDLSKEYEYHITNLILSMGLENELQKHKSENDFEFWAKIIETYFSDVLNGKFKWNNFSRKSDIEP